MIFRCPSLWNISMTSLYFNSLKIPSFSAEFSDAHSAFVSSSRQLIATTKKKLGVMNGMSDELRYLTRQIQDDREVQSKNRKGGDVDPSIDKLLAKHINIMGPPSPRDPAEGPKALAKTKSPRRTNQKSKKIKKGDESLCDMAKRYCKGKSKKYIKLDPLKYLETVEINKKDRQEMEEKYRQMSESHKELYGCQVADDGSESEECVTSSDDKTPRVMSLPVVKITRKSARKKSIKSDVYIYDKDKTTKRSFGEQSDESQCVNCLKSVTRDKLSATSKQGAGQSIKAHSNSESHTKNRKSLVELCEKHNGTRHSNADFTDTVYTEVKDDLLSISSFGTKTVSKMSLPPSTKDKKRVPKAGRLQSLSSKMHLSENWKEGCLSLELSPEKYSPTKVLCFDKDGRFQCINNIYLSDRPVLRPNKVTLQSSSPVEESFLPLDDSMPRFRFRLGKKPTFPLSFDPRSNGKQNNYLPNVAKSKSFYDYFST